MRNVVFDVVLGNGHVYHGQLVDFNQHWNVYLTGELDENYKLIESGKMLDEDDYYQLWCGCDTLGFWHYGARQLDDSIDHQAGYMWSSRASVMNKYLPSSRHIADVAVNQMTTAVCLEDLKRILKAASAVQSDLAIDIVRWDDDGETAYHIISLLNEEHDVHEVLKEEV